MNCNDIEREAEELKMKFKNCTTLKSDDLKQLMDLVLKLNECKSDKLDTVLGAEITSFQFINLGDDINSIDILTTSHFLEDNGTYQSEGALLDGIDIQFFNVARFGFFIKNLPENPYLIQDELSNNITNIAFDYIYSNGISYFVSKEYITPSTNYFKFIKNYI